VREKPPRAVVLDEVESIGELIGIDRSGFIVHVVGARQLLQRQWIVAEQFLRDRVDPIRGDAIALERRRRLDNVTAASKTCVAVYRPGGIAAMTYSPAVFVCTSRTPLVAALVSVIVTPGHCRSARVYDDATDVTPWVFAREPEPQQRERQR
jgi:hypothetical protein